MFSRKKYTRNWKIYTDGAIRPEFGLSGLAVVVYDESDTIAFWWTQAVESMTCNEAEYAAALFALQQLRIYRPLAIDLFSDSQVMVQQMRGEASVRSEGLKVLNRRLHERVREYEQVTFQHIPREENRVADALAYEVVMRQIRKNGGKENVCAKKPLFAYRPSGR